ncbi:hypothetical protein B0H14DRAFT_2298766, partial [Mycena olivaceomarginata]
LCDPSIKQGLFSTTPSMVAGVSPTRPKIYFYQPLLATFVQLTKYSLREDKSRTETSGTVKTMRENVVRRDGVLDLREYSGEGPEKRPHMPQAHGRPNGSTRLHDFCALPIALQSILDPIFGLTLIRGLDSYFGVYKLGFRKCFRDVLEVHVFAMTENSRINMDGTTNNHAPLTHGYRIRPPTPQDGFSTPPEGLFEWHYLQ